MKYFAAFVFVLMSVGVNMMVFEKYERRVDVNIGVVTEVAPRYNAIGSLMSCRFTAATPAQDKPFTYYDENERLTPWWHDEPQVTACSLLQKGDRVQIVRLEPCFFGTSWCNRKRAYRDWEPLSAETAYANTK